MSKKTVLRQRIPPPQRRRKPAHRYGVEQTLLVGIVVSAVGEDYRANDRSRDRGIDGDLTMADLLGEYPNEVLRADLPVPLQPGPGRGWRPHSTRVSRIRSHRICGSLPHKVGLSWRASAKRESISCATDTAARTRRSSRRADATCGGGVSGVIDDNVPAVGREAKHNGPSYSCGRQLAAYLLFGAPAHSRIVIR